MRITLVTSGTRGDAQPLAVLAVELTRRGHDVTLGLPPNLVDLGLRCGIRTAPFGPDTLAFMESPEGVRWLASGDLSAFMRELGQVSKAHIVQTMREMRDLADGADLVVGGLLAEDLALPSAEALGVPYASFHSAPYRRTRDFPQLMVTTRSLPRPLNRATGALFDRVWWKEVRDNVAAYRTQLGLAADPTPTATRLDRSGTLEIQGYSASLVPAPTDYGTHRPLVGLPAPDADLRRELGDAVLDGKLDGWLAAGSAPVYVGMGSMPIQSPEQTLATVTDVVRRLGVRAVVSAGWSRLVPPSGESESGAEDVFVVGAVDHDALLPRCRGAVHHGGAGTTHASLSAGLPTMICSVFADQPFWGARVERLGVGVHEPFAKLDAPRLREGLERLLAPATVERAAQLGAQLRAEQPAAAVAADLLERLGDPASRQEGPALSS